MKFTSNFNYDGKIIHEMGPASTHLSTSHYPEDQEVDSFNHWPLVGLTGLVHVDCSVQDCSNSSALAMKLLQSCTKPSMCSLKLYFEIDFLLMSWEMQLQLELCNSIVGSITILGYPQVRWQYAKHTGLPCNLTEIFLEIFGSILHTSVQNIFAKDFLLFKSVLGLFCLYS